jgi:hypothetical protein
MISENVGGGKASLKTNVRDNQARTESRASVWSACGFSAAIASRGTTDIMAAPFTVGEKAPLKTVALQTLRAIRRAASVSGHDLRAEAIWLIAQKCVSGERRGLTGTRARV